MEVGGLLRYKTWFNLTFILKHLYQIRTIEVVFELSCFCPDIAICYTDFPFRLFLLTTARFYQFCDFVITLHSSTSGLMTCLFFDLVVLIYDFSHFLITQQSRYGMFNRGMLLQTCATTNFHEGKEWIWYFDNDSLHRTLSCFKTMFIFSAHIDLDEHKKDIETLYDKLHNNYDRYGKVCR